MIYLLKIVIFNSYVDLPEGICNYLDTYSPTETNSAILG